jgi:hypothetical protein
VRLNFVLLTVQIVHNSFPETWLKSLWQGDRRDLLASVHCDQGKEEVRPQPISTEVKESSLDGLSTEAWKRMAMSPFRRSAKMMKYLLTNLEESASIPSAKVVERARTTNHSRDCFRQLGAFRKWSGSGLTSKSQNPTEIHP